MCWCVSEGSSLTIKCVAVQLNGNLTCPACPAKDEVSIDSIAFIRQNVSSEHSFQVTEKLIQSNYLSFLCAFIYFAYVYIHVYILACNLP